MDEQNEATPTEEITPETPMEAPEELVTEEVEAEPVKVHAEPAAELPKKLTNQPKYIGAPVPGRIDKLKSFITECKRVLRVTKKPDRAEYMTIVKISAIGIGVIGLIGFIVHLVQQLLF